MVTPFFENNYLGIVAKYRKKQASQEWTRQGGENEFGDKNNLETGPKQAQFGPNYFMVSKGVRSPPFIIVIPPFCSTPPFQILKICSPHFINSPHLEEFSRFLLLFQLSEKFSKILILIQLFFIWVTEVHILYNTYSKGWMVQFQLSNFFKIKGRPR